MFVAMFSTVLFLAVAHARASCVGDSTLAPAPMFRALFRALRTGVLEISEGLDASWLKYYDILLTEESINRFQSLLFGESIDVPQYDSERLVIESDSTLKADTTGQTEVCASAFPRNRAATSLQDALVRMMKGGAGKEALPLDKLLLKYAFFKVWLHKGLDPAESKMLENIFSGDTGTCRFVSRLIHAKDHSGLLAAFADGWESKAVTLVMHSLNAENPHVITELIQKYVEKHESLVRIPLDLFKKLTVECRYLLAIKLADLRPYDKEIDWYTFYTLSRFSKYPSEKIRALCLENNTNLLIHEGEKVHGSGRQPTGMKAFSPYVLPKEVWLKILLYLDELTHVYVAWVVCKLWTELGCDILRESLAVQTAWARDLRDPVKWNRILHNSCYPWNHLFGSRLASSKHLASRPDTVTEASEAMRGEIGTAWDLICSDIDEGRLEVSHELYLATYVRCCRASRFPLEFIQLPGMSDKEYAALVRSLVYQYDIIPTVPDVFLGKRCEAFVKMLEKHSDLIILLFRDDPYYYNSLAAHLLSAKSCIPLTIAKILAERSSFYKLLLGRRDGIEEHFDIVPQGFMTHWHKTPICHSVVDLCLSLGPGSDSEALRHMREAVIGYCCGPHASEETKYQKLKELSIDILVFLYLNRRNYSVEELNTIEYVLEECRVCGSNDDEDIFEYPFVLLLNNHQFIIKLIPQFSEKHKEDTQVW